MNASEPRELAQKVKVAEAEGIVLDWMVAKAEGLNPAAFVERDYGQVAFRPLSRWCGINVSPAGHDVYAPSTDWPQGGPIIDRECIYFSPLPDNGIRAYRFIDGSPRDLMDCWGDGATRLIAAMRCYVATKLGEEVNVPEELL